jgi:predicted phosphoadenosine phosphosulfate sulfurtransferase
MPKNPIGINVLEASRQRISFAFDNFEKLYISFSAGKDSNAMIHLVMEEAIKRNKKVGVLFIDWECQASLTIQSAEQIFELYKEHIDLHWIQLPMTTWNGCSVYEPEWTAWDENKKDLWVRQKSKLAKTDASSYPFYYDKMTFEEFIPLFASWYSEGKSCGAFVGIRTQESLNRYRTIARNKPTFNGKQWTTNVIEDVWNVYPIYDWVTEDIWTYFAKSGKPYNRLYDRMYQAGLSIHQMRICEPFGDTQRQGLWLYQVIEPEMWSKMVLRVSGANTGALYAHEKGSVLGNHSISLPEGHTYKSFCISILDSMPSRTAEHYKNKIAVYVKWWQARGYPDGIPDLADKSLEAKGKVPSWRRICKTVLRNDYWCRGLGFSPTKSDAYENYCKRIQEKRKEWNILK